MSDILIKEHNYSVFCSLAREKCVQPFLLYRSMEDPVPQLTGSQAEFVETSFLWERPSLYAPPNHCLAPTSGKTPFGAYRISDACKMAASCQSSGDCLRVLVGIKTRSSFGFWFSDFSFKLSLKATRKMLLLFTWKATVLVPGEKESWGVTIDAWNVKPSSYLVNFPLKTTQTSVPVVLVQSSGMCCTMQITVMRAWLSVGNVSFPTENWNRTCHTPRWTSEDSSWGSCVIFATVNLLWTMKSKVDQPADSRLRACWFHALAVSAYTFPTSTGQEYGCDRHAALIS